MRPSRWARFNAGVVMLLVLVFPGIGFALEVNNDGQHLILEAAQAYQRDMRDRALIDDPAVVDYLRTIVNRLAPARHPLPTGVSLAVNVIDSPTPMVYAYVNGHIVVSIGLVHAMENEAQLAGVLSHEVALLAEGHYINLYQGIKKAERRERYKAAAGALFGALLDTAVGYAVNVENINTTSAAMAGEISYKEAMIRTAGLTAAESAYFSIKDVVATLPTADGSGNTIDPRRQLEPIADMQGMARMAQAGYDAMETANGWAQVHRLLNKEKKERERMLGAFGDSMRQMQQLTEQHLVQMRQQLGATGLVQTLAEAPPAKAGFVRQMNRLTEVRNAQAAKGADKAEAPYRKFLLQTVQSKANMALEDDEFGKAAYYYGLLYDRGVKTAPVTYGLARSRMGDFAFSASSADKRKAEKLYRQALKSDARYGPAHRSLGELYEDWERYEDAIAAYQDYLKVSPKAKDKGRVQRRIKMLKRKASR